MMSKLRHSRENTSTSILIRPVFVIIGTDICENRFADDSKRSNEKKDRFVEALYWVV